MKPIPLLLGVFLVSLSAHAADVEITNAPNSIPYQDEYFYSHATIDGEDWDSTLINDLTCLQNGECITVQDYDCAGYTQALSGDFNGSTIQVFPEVHMGSQGVITGNFLVGDRAPARLLTQTHDNARYIVGEDYNLVVKCAVNTYYKNFSVAPERGLAEPLQVTVDYAGDNSFHFIALGIVFTIFLLPLLWLFAQVFKR